jgi:hypothetical protein
VTLTATVSPKVTGSATPTQTITFYDASTSPATQIGSVQYLSHFRSSLAYWKVVGLRLFCFWPPWGPEAKRSGDGHDFGQSAHLQIAFGTPLSCGNMP